jgi:hypothetical protein
VGKAGFEGGTKQEKAGKSGFEGGTKRDLKIEF